MAKFMIEVRHEDDKLACEHSIAIFLNSGSHFLTNADWGCMDGDHTGWLVLEAENAKQALMVVPAVQRHNAKAVKLVRFSPQDIEAMHE